jgi:hypothetical protein
LGTTDIRWQQVPSAAFESAYRIAIRKERGFSLVGAAGMLKPQLLSNIGHSSTAPTGFAFGFGLERLAMLKLGIDDIRDLWGPKYCPVADNFAQCDLHKIAARRACCSGEASPSQTPSGGKDSPILELFA